jgi:hypothetical protein
LQPSEAGDKESLQSVNRRRSRKSIPNQTLMHS